MAGGGTWIEGVPKERPGTYINTKSERPPEIDGGYSGIALLPLINFPYGPDREFFEIDTLDLNGQFERLGFDLNYENEYTAAIRECARGAQTILCYNVRGGTKAKAEADPPLIEGASSEGEPLPNPVTATARYGGTRGNDFEYSVEANPDGGYDVTVFIKNETVERFEGIETVEDLTKSGSRFIDFTGTGDLVPAAGIKLTGGTDKEVTNYDISKFLDASESMHWNVLAFPVDGAPIDGDKDASDTLLALMRMVAAKIIYLRDQCGKSCKAVVVNYDANHEAITDTPVGMYAKNDFHLLNTDMAAWYAGQAASASKTTSFTNVVYKNGARPDREMTNKEIENAIKAGKLLFTLNDNNEVVVEYDINTLTDFDRPRDKTYRKNRVIRTLDALRDRIRREFPPNKFDNNETGWKRMEAVGRGILLEFQRDNAITNVVEEEDFTVDRTASMDDFTFFDVWVQVVDSAEKLYFRLHTK